MLRFASEEEYRRWDACRRQPTRATELRREAQGLVITLPLRLASLSNLREHWAKGAARAKDQRWAVYTNLRCTYWLVPPLPLTITLIRISPHRLDSGNLEACFKHVQDGTADWLCGAYGQGQDRQQGLTWQYAQRKGTPRQYGVEIRIEPGT